MSLTIVTNSAKIRQNFNQSIPTGWRILIIVLLILGIFFRFYNLDHKVYWQDETFTSLRIAGYRSKELSQQVFDGWVIGIDQLHKYQQPNAEKGLFDTVKTLAIEEPQNPPLYFAIARVWARIFGYYPAAIRSLSAVMGVLVLPCVYWLCWELFSTPIVSLFAMALVAVSPFQVAYAQEARGYALWTVITLLSSIFLLRAMRQKTLANWGIYALTLIAGFYTFPLTVFVAIAHGIYVFVIEKFRNSQTVVFYTIATLVSLLAFTPWIGILIANYQSAKQTTSWLGKALHLPILVKTWGFQLSSIFIWTERLPERRSLLIAAIVVLGVGYSIYLITRRTSQRIWLFVLTLIAANLLPLILADLVQGGVRSTITRYLIPCVLGIQITVAFALSTQIFAVKPMRNILKVITVLVIYVGIISCWYSAQATTLTWKRNTHDSLKIAQIINKASHPLLVSSNYQSNPSEIFSMSYLLSPNTKLQLVTEPNVPKISVVFSDVFLFNPSEKMRSQIEQQQNTKIKPVGAEDLSLWKLTSL